MIDILRELHKKLGRNAVLENELMSKHTSFKIGGPADYFVKPKNIDEIKFVLELCNKNNIPLTIVGNGTNLLVSDKGIRGIVLKPELNDFAVKRTKDRAKIIVGSSFPVGKLSNIAIKEELTGVEFLSGIPGTIGGAIRMNAGAYGREMKDVVISTKYMEKNGKIKKIDLKDHKFEYRNSIFSKLDVIILETTLELHYGEKEQISSTVNEYMKSRLEKQPLDLPNAGSTFKRKGDVITAKLIDECGLKGYRIGDAAVSEKHAGFIVNLGNATCKDVVELTNYIKKKVKEKFDQDIELEILMIGEM